MARMLAGIVALAFILSLGMGPIAHAMEPVECADPAVSIAADDTAGDSGRTGDGDGAVAHHHGGCHGHHNVTIADTASPAGHPAGLNIALPAPCGALPGRGAGPGLRPPIA